MSYEIRVDEEGDGSRLDRFIADHVEGASRTAVQKHISLGLIEIDGAPPKRGAKTQVRRGELITYTPPEPEPVDVEPEDIPLDIIHEDRDIIVVNKPARMVVHPSLGHARGTLVNALLHHVEDLKPIGDHVRPGLVHRLDQDTTGVMVVAKNQIAFDGLKAQFMERKVHKLYLAVAHGLPDPREGTYDTPFGRHPRDRKKFSSKIRAEKRAVTHYWVERVFPGACMLALELMTGRTHQIRVHCQDHGHPLVGDPVYGAKPKRISKDPRVRPILTAFPRPALHAYELSFKHPGTRRRVEFVAPAPEDLEGLVDALEQASTDPVEVIG